MAVAQNPMHTVARHRAQLPCPLWPQGSLDPSTGSRRGRAMGAGRECPRRAGGQGVKALAIWSQTELL